jgi:hypothetical protein
LNQGARSLRLWLDFDQILTDPADASADRLALPEMNPDTLLGAGFEAQA